MVCVVGEMRGGAGACRGAPSCSGVRSGALGFEPGALERVKALVNSGLALVGSEMSTGRARPLSLVLVLSCLNLNKCLPRCNGVLSRIQAYYHDRPNTYTPCAYACIVLV